jgi:peroxiredoxin
MRAWFTSILRGLVVTVFMALGSLSGIAHAAEEPTLVGKHIADFELQDYLGTKHALADWHDKKVVVVAFLGAECPMAKLYAPRLAELAERYEPKGVQFVAIDANQQDGLAKIAQFVRTSKIDFPVLKDLGNKVADHLGATRTPEVFVLDDQRAVRYWGAIDDQYGVGFTRAGVSKEYLVAALDNLLAGELVRTPTTPAIGCFIGKVNHKAPTGEITYTKQIARVFNDHCVECHRTGQVAPFTLTSYDDAVGWADTIREVIRTERMPPWLADPKFGKFRNDCRLTDAEKDLVYQWIDHGMPQGVAADLPKLPEFDPAWRIPKPDLIVRMPQPFTVPAKGIVPYQYFTVDPGFTEDKWVRSAEGRPGNRAVVHHMLLFYIPPGQQQPKPLDALSNAVASFVPGMPANNGPETHARLIPAGSKLVFQMHYTPNGAETTDQSEAGLVFADPKQVQKQVSLTSALNWKFQIPPGAPDYKVEARAHIPQDVTIYSLTPHMHWRGKSFRFTAVYPDQHEEVLLDVPRYDFNWQNTYLLAEPKFLPDGTDIVCEAHFDNSANNPVNPDPTETVRWGDQTFQEMVVGSFSMSPAEQDLLLGPPQVKSAGDGKFEVRFRYRPNAAVDKVYLAGQFNDWKSDDLKMEGPDADGFFSKIMTLSEGVYQYKFVVDGKNWKPDPGNLEQAGDFHNSVVHVRKAATTGAE